MIEETNPTRHEIDLALSLAVDLAAIGLVVQDRRDDPIPGGVWIAPSLDVAGVAVAWAQPEAAADVLGLPMQAEIQRKMNLALYDILQTLGYPVGGYGGGGAYIVTGPRLPLTPAETA